MTDTRDLSPAVRTMRREEVALSLGWAAREGWNPGLNDADCFYAADPDGFLVAEVDGKAVGCISAVAYGNDFGFLGLYIVLPEHRGKGYGMALWKAAMIRLGNRNIGLDGVVAQQDNYRRSGFKLAHRNVRYELKPEDHSAAISILEDVMRSGSNLKVRPLGDCSSNAFAVYDTALFGAKRQDFLKCWIHQAGATSLAASDGNVLTGYGVVRPCVVGSKIGPLFADNEEIAKAILLELLKRTSLRGPIYLDVPEPNKTGVQLAQICGMVPVFETARMYTNNDPDLPLPKIYGITSFELG